MVHGTHSARKARAATPVFEVVRPEPRNSFVWHTHDYPAPCARWNYHPEYELHLITKGCGQYMVGDYFGFFAPGNLVLIGPNVPHDWFSDVTPGESVPDRNIVLQVNKSWFTGLMTLCPELDVLHGLLAASGRGVEFLGPGVAALGARLAGLGTMDDAARIPAIIGLLLDLAQCSYRTLCSAGLTLSPDDRELEKIDSIIRNIIDDNIVFRQQAEIAKAVGLSAPAFSRQFRRATGDTFVSFMKKLRIGKACQLLMTTDASIADISAATGFGNLSNFNRQFLQIRQTTPSQYRRDVRRLVKQDAETAKIRNDRPYGMHSHHAQRYVQ
ncbi:helix-turn-helix domain-containing protein [Gluconacetobacter diazotrophicus]|uniref:Helix-turn-helix domain-containing protein n=1 Tax=Gluconacetobacter diazotrophicus TaxID=33996 RepID=A0A7W4I8L1_GLUDI|nr:helix-turn-helix domain-containing protein [Gluconacetobacter diazotrophicus]MBB2158225.1 helix-turn-helix domain-containing protein [Gluconacetobacter diazotrophicus]